MRHQSEARPIGKRLQGIGRAIEQYARRLHRIERTPWRRREARRLRALIAWQAERAGRLAGGQRDVSLGRFEDDARRLAWEQRTIEMRKGFN